MAMRDEVKEQQQKLKGKSFQEKLGYFWDYYKVHTIVVLFAAFAIGIFIKDMVTSKDDAFSAVVLNSYGYEQQADFQEDFAAYAGIDTKTYNCQIDASSTLSLDAMTQLDLAFSQRLAGMVQTNALDAFISDTEIFGHYAEEMMFQDLREELDAEEYEKYEPYFYYVDAALIEQKAQEQEEFYSDSPQEDAADPADPSAMEEPVPVGIYLPDSAKLAQWNCYADGYANGYADTGESPVFGFVFSGQHLDIAHLFLAYLTG